MLILAALSAALLCLAETHDAASHPAVPGRKPLAAALFCALVLLVAIQGLVAILPGGPVRRGAAALVLLIGLQWLVRAVVRLLGRPDGPAGTPFAGVLAGGVEIVIACSAVFYAVAPGGVPWGWYGLAGFGGVCAARLRRVGPDVSAPVVPERAARPAIPPGAGASSARARSTVIPVMKLVLAVGLTAVGAAGSGDPWIALIATATVTLAALRLRAWPGTSRAAARAGTSPAGFLLGDTALTWPATGVHVVAAGSLPSASWLTGLLLAALLVPLFGVATRSR
ncbi:hypothetical protein KIH74_30620 [Kineosporia sp. J2-2]|uniref:Uncharacterized protein n=1 Tax=Kineosporia corallincola TaxID=2835133 RepID=A0ABS5TR29_9ACTN|nr:hypothetical protein [Kineosporia corallincola]MBT0773339.1 hypothetical protein [Kineosporia corallincola]